MIKTSDDATRSDEQHRKPCGDCPFRRKAVAGWLGSMTAEEWLRAVHGEALIDCHTVVGSPQPQCAGSAIYRANVGKLPRDPRIVRLRPDAKTVFATPKEFSEHHKSSPVLDKSGNR